MPAWLLSLIGGPIVNGLIGAYKAKLSVTETKEHLAADLAAKKIEAEIEANAQAHAIIKAEQGWWFTALPRPLFAFAVVIYLWKVIVWDKVLGWGVTDPLTGSVAEYAALIVSVYFGGRSIEKVARIIRGR